MVGSFGYSAFLVLSFVFCKIGSFGSLLFIWFNSDRYASQVSTHMGFNFTGHGSCKIRRTFLVLSFVFCFPIWMLSSFDTIFCFNLHSYFDNYHKGKSYPIIQAPSTSFFGYLHRWIFLFQYAILLID